MKITFLFPQSGFPAHQSVLNQNQYVLSACCLVILFCGLLFARTVNQQLSKMGDESVKQFCYVMPKIVST